MVFRDNLRGLLKVQGERGTQEKVEKVDPHDDASVGPTRTPKPVAKATVEMHLNQALLGCIVQASPSDT